MNVTLEVAQNIKISIFFKGRIYFSGIIIYVLLLNLCFVWIYIFVAD